MGSSRELIFRNRASTSSEPRLKISTPRAGSQTRDAREGVLGDRPSAGDAGPRDDEVGDSLENSGEGGDSGLGVILLSALGVVSLGCPGVRGGERVSREPIKAEGTEDRGVDTCETAGDNKPLGSAPATTSIMCGNALRLDEGCQCFFIDPLCVRAFNGRFIATSSSEETCTLWVRISFASVCTPSDWYFFLTVVMLELRDRTSVTGRMPSSLSESISSSTSPS